MKITGFFRLLKAGINSLTKFGKLIIMSMIIGCLFFVVGMIIYGVVDSVVIRNVGLAIGLVGLIVMIIFGIVLYIYFDFLR